MKLLKTERRRWSGPFGDTHTGRRWLLFGFLPIWQTRRAVRRQAA